MLYSFDIIILNNLYMGKLWFNFNNKNYNYLFKIFRPYNFDYENINRYYFGLEYIINGKKINYIEYANCFSILACDLESNENISLFDLKIYREFKNTNIKKLKNLFIDIHICIINKIKKNFNIIEKYKDVEVEIINLYYTNLKKLEENFHDEHKKNLLERLFGACFSTCFEKQRKKIKFFDDKILEMDVYSEYKIDTIKNTNYSIEESKNNIDDIESWGWYVML
jgi:hypothetical protein